MREEGASVENAGGLGTEGLDVEGEETEVLDAGGNETESEETDPVEEAYCLGAGIEPETLKKAKELLKEIREEKGFNPTALQFALRILNYEKSLEEAHKRGLEAGRAEQIAAGFRDKRSIAREAEELPHLGGTKNIGRGSESSIFDVARGAN